LWSETQIEFKRRKISNRQRIVQLSNTVHKAIKELLDKKPNLTYGEALAVLEKEYSLLSSGAQAGASLGDALKKRSLRTRS
jgi:hypothetical protein